MFFYTTGDYYDNCCVDMGVVRGLNYFHITRVRRRSVQDEIANLVNPSIQDAYYNWEEVSCSKSPCPKEDFDYQCTYVVDTWPEMRKTNHFKGPTDARLVKAK